MNIRQKLTNPFALVAQGFGMGALLFFAAMALDPDSPPQSHPVQSASTAKSLTA